MCRQVSQAQLRMIPAVWLVTVWLVTVTIHRNQPETKSSPGK
jgi:hypothetical protein